MASRKAKQKKKGEPQKDELTKEETAVAKHLRFNVATKKTTVFGQPAEYFTAAKAVDLLLDSKWATGKDVLFTTRQSVVDYLQRLLNKGLFYRALKVIQERKERKDKDKDKEKEKEKEKEKKDEKKEKEEGGEKEKKSSKKKKKELKKDGEDTPTPSGKKLKEVKRKFKLEMHDEQIFIDGSDAYVWVYDPTHPKTFIMGLLLVIGAAMVCLFPLWPPWMRLVTYYISLVAACLVGSILVLAVFRCILFVLIWAVTFGKHHFWLFPNLMADVGILESFKPVYIHKAMTAETTSDTDDKETKKTESTELEQAQKNEDSEQNQEDEKENEQESENEEKDPDDQKDSDGAEEGEKFEGDEFKRSDSSNGSGTGEGFEVIHPEEITAVTEEMEETESKQS